MNINADFREDFINLVFKEINKLKKLGFHFDDFSVWKKNQVDKLLKRIDMLKAKGEDYSYEKDSLDAKKLLRDYRRDMVHWYFNLRQRIPAQTPRRIFRCSQFSCPKGLETGLSILEKKIIAGENLLPHLSRKIVDPVFSDYMFYDFGLVHFHLGTKSNIKNPLLIEGTKEIVYAFMNEDSCYFIKIDDHGKWDDIALLECLKKDFPAVLEPLKITGEPLWKPTKEERKKMLHLQINSYVEIDGENYLAPGMGVNAAGTSGLAVMEMNRFFHQCVRIQNSAITMLEKNQEKIEDGLGFKLNDMDLELMDINPIIIYDKNNMLFIDFDLSRGSMQFRT